MNESGYSFVETILSVVIVMLLCTTLIPISYTMKTTLYNKKLEVIAAETAYEGLKHFRYLQQTEGTKTIEHVDFQWSIIGQGICVSFQNTQELRKKCIQLTGEVDE
ncbi:hypothetical protein AMS59_19800 [Lysinibacillus sp. FJAT-14745]|uniref:hypothetical protein n=1 Tax=Lysinibacillus sp. FJAT-14745 TaxID=1704289 RepID=UPI0006AB9EBB|nr:hypothetical protein [Lysinibacillus sp. FJAT-14745]KOP70476.1 hypothetical protein AMS59_19800 [Lysinibacillus sp. FJAT-14745]